MALYLRRAGHKVTVFDRRPDIRTVEFSGRSINLAMSDRGWKALERIGIDQEVRKIGIPRLASVRLTCASSPRRMVRARRVTSAPPLIAIDESRV